MRFSIRIPPTSAKVCCEQFPESREELQQLVLGWLWFRVDDLAAPFPEPREGTFESVRDRIVRELRDLAESLRERLQVLREDFALHVPTEPGRGKVRRGDDDRSVRQGDRFEKTCRMLCLCLVKTCKICLLSLANP